MAVCKTGNPVTVRHLSVLASETAVEFPRKGAFPWKRLPLLVIGVAPVLPINLRKERRRVTKHAQCALWIDWV